MAALSQLSYSPRQRVRLRVLYRDDLLIGSRRQAQVDDAPARDLGDGQPVAALGVRAVHGDGVDLVAPVGGANVAARREPASSGVDDDHAALAAAHLALDPVKAVLD